MDFYFQTERKQIYLQLKPYYIKFTYSLWHELTSFGGETIIAPPKKSIIKDFIFPLAPKQHSSKKYNINK